MAWKLWLDDVRPLADEMHQDGWIHAHTAGEAEFFIVMLGAPEFVSFDHDLGEGNRTGMDFAKYLVEEDIRENGMFLPEDFDFIVHSANPVGAMNISTYLLQYLKVKSESQPII